MASNMEAVRGQEHLAGPLLAGDLEARLVKIACVSNTYRAWCDLVTAPCNATLPRESPGGSLIDVWGFAVQQGLKLLGLPSKTGEPGRF